MDEVVSIRSRGEDAPENTQDMDKEGKGYLVVDDGRHFDNPFPYNSEDEKSPVLNESKHELSEDFTENLKESVKDFLKVLESDIPSTIDWNDVSVYTGCSGYTLLFLHLADVLEQDKFLKKAQPMAEECASKTKGKRHTFLCGDAGPLAVAAAVYSKLNMKSEATTCIERLRKLERDVLDPSSGLPDEILYGRAGYLYALVYLQEKFGKSVIEDKAIRSVITAILDSGKAMARKENLSVPLMYEWHEKKYVGAAHGFMGILFMLLQLKDHLTSDELHEKIKPTVDYVCTLQFSSGNMPSSLNNETDRLVHWCHGAPGAVFLLAKAYQVFGDESYLEHARKSADCVWERGLLRKGYGLCHGTSGNGYALLYFYQVTKETEYLYRAAQFARWCRDYGKHGCRTPDRPLSLFEGLAGTVYFLTDIMNPEKAKFPAFVI
ncbi:lanC-like protein 2 isoform X2 [Palaemon carinicauda]|uniref:lanC-like protein 2 isoform X2 n=1 Tax=Palaemon carinicauda TaxID=392227 RepID=UPI0035B66547